MSTARERAESYREEAKACLDLGARMSVKTDRARLIEMAQHWMHLAEIAEAKAAKGEDDY